METIVNTWIWAPIGVVFLNMFKDELSKVIKTYRAWRNRVFKVGDSATLWNEATCDWGVTVQVLKYVWSLDSNRRGVYVYWPGRGIVKISILKWVDWFKVPVEVK